MLLRSEAGFLRSEAGFLRRGEGSQEEGEGSQEGLFSKGNKWWAASSERGGVWLLKKGGRVLNIGTKNKHKSFFCGISRQKSLISLVSRDVPNFLAPTPSCGRPLPLRKISGL